MLKNLINWMRQFEIKRIAVTLLIVGYFFIPIAPAPVNIAIFSCLLFGSFSKKIRERYKALFKEKLFICFFAFYALLLLSCFYGPGAWSLKLNYLGKYLEIGYMPLLAAIVYEKKYRDVAIKVFSSSMLLTLTLSYLVYFGTPFQVLNLGWSPSGAADNPTIFKLQITHNFFMAFAVFLWLRYGLEAKSVGIKIAYLLLSLIGTLNIFLMVGGRTGYITFFALTLVVIYEKISIRRLMLGFLVCMATSIAVYQYVPKVQSKINLGLAEARDWVPNQGSVTSIGLRLDFWNASYELIKKAPIFGSGIAGYEEGYKEIAVGTGLGPSVNPHNQYLLFLTQIGWFGLLAFIWLNFIVWITSYRLERNWGLWVRGVILGYVVANLFNSMLLDFAEGIFLSASLAIAFSSLLHGGHDLNKEGGLT